MDINKGDIIAPATSSARYKVIYAGVHIVRAKNVETGSIVKIGVEHDLLDWSVIR